MRSIRSPLPKAKFDALVEETLKHSTSISEVKELEPLIEKLSHAKIVMLGESTHGTQEFYEWRRLISQWLIVKHGFRAIAVEGDWPSCRKLDHYIQSRSGADFESYTSARQVLEHFSRWPTWMWANTEVIRLAEWMKSHNSKLRPDARVGFYGLDVYSMFESIREVIEQVKTINPFLAKRIRHHYSCFDRYQANEKAYVRGLLQLNGCEKDVNRAVEDLIDARRNSRITEDADWLDIQQNALVVKNAESYYRAMIHADELSWNIRDQHMLQTLENLLEQNSKIIVWAHNTHIGDYRATDMKEAGMVNLGGLARERWGTEVVALVGFGTYEGSVIASHAWDGPIQTLPVPPAREESYEAIFHAAAKKMESSQFFISFGSRTNSSPLSELHSQRAIGVVYDPEHERFGNYVPTAISRRYDAFFFVDQTRALEPLIQGFDQRELPETWPQGQ